MPHRPMDVRGPLTRRWTLLFLLATALLGGGAGTTGDAAGARPLVVLPPRLLALLERRLEHERLLGAFDLLREVTLAAAALTLGFGLIALAWRELRRRALVLEAFDMAPALQAEGWSGVVAARRLHDQLVQIREHVVTSVEKRALTQAGTGAGSDITIPGAHVSLAGMFAYLRAALGRDTYVAGEITGAGEELSVNVRVRDRAPASFSGPRSTLDVLLRQAAEHVLLHTEPYITAVYRWHAGDNPGAIAALRLCALSPDRREASNALNLWGDVLFEAGDRTGAVARYEAALRREPTNQWSHVNLMVALTSAGRWPEAEALVERYIRLRPRSALAHGLRAQMALYAADVVSSQLAADRAEQLDGHDAGAGVTRSWADVLRHDYTSARDRAERLAADPRTRFTENTINARVTVLIRSLIGLHDYALARDYADELRTERPRYHGGWLGTGHLHLVFHEYDAAEENLRRAARWGRRSIGGTALLARALHRSRGAGAALCYVADSLAESPRDPMLLVAWGEILLAEGEVALAQDKFQQAASMSTGYPDPYEGWGRALAARGDIVAAQARLDRAIGIAPKWAAPHVAWGDILVAQGDAAGAIARYEQAIALDPLGAVPFAQWGALLERLGDAAGAQAKYARARALDPANPAFRRFADPATPPQPTLAAAMPVSRS